MKFCYSDHFSREILNEFLIRFSDYFCTQFIANTDFELFIRKVFFFFQHTKYTITTLKENSKSIFIIVSLITIFLLCCQKRRINDFAFSFIVQLINFETYFHLWWWYWTEQCREIRLLVLAFNNKVFIHRTHNIIINFVELRYVNNFMIFVVSVMLTRKFAMMLRKRLRYCCESSYYVEETLSYKYYV